MEITLSKDADHLLCLVYKMYLEKRDLGMTKADAKFFGSSHTIHEQVVPEWRFEDVDDTCRELSVAKMLNVNWADDIAYIVRLSNNGIIYMENRFKNGISEVIDFIAKFKPW